MAEILSTVPTVIRAGDTVKWKKSFPDYPSSEWALQYAIYNQTNYYTVNAIAEEDGSFLITISATESAAFDAGEYHYIARVSKNNEVYTVESGTIKILPDVTSAVDDRSHVKKVLDALEAVIEGRATRTDLEYQIGDKRIRNMSHGEIYMLWKKYKWLYELELQAQGIKTAGNKVKVRFT